MDIRGFVVQFPVRVKDSSLSLRNTQTCSGAQSCAYECVAGTFPGDDAVRCVKLDRSYPYGAETEDACNCPCTVWRTSMTCTWIAVPVRY